MKPTRPCPVLAFLVQVVLMVCCSTGGTSPSRAAPSLASSSVSPSAGSTSPSTGKPTFEVKQQAADGPEITILIFDPAGALASARGAMEADESPLITSESEVGPRIGSVPGVPNDLRVLWGGWVCDTSYTIWIGTNEDGGPYIDVTQGPLSNPDCDALGIRRGVVLTFSSPVDATKATGGFHSSVPQ